MPPQKVCDKRTAARNSGKSSVLIHQPMRTGRYRTRRFYRTRLLHLYDYFEDAHGLLANEVTNGPEPAKPVKAVDEVKLERIVSGSKAQITVNHEIGEVRHQVPFPRMARNCHDFIVGERRRIRVVQGSVPTSRPRIADPSHVRKTPVADIGRGADPADAVEFTFGANEIRAGQTISTVAEAGGAKTGASSQSQATTPPGGGG